MAGKTFGMERWLVSPGDHIRVLKTGEKNYVRLEKGNHFRVVHPDARGVTQKESVEAVREGADLTIKYPDGTEMIVPDYYATCADGSCSLALGDGSKLGHVLNAAAPAEWLGPVSVYSLAAPLVVADVPPPAASPVTKPQPVVDPVPVAQPPPVAKPVPPTAMKPVLPPPPRPIAEPIAAAADEGGGWGVWTWLGLGGLAAGAAGAGGGGGGEDSGPDTLAPSLAGSTPTAGATAVPLGRNILLTFNETVQAGSGSIVISNGSDTRVISVTDTTQVSFSGNTVALNPADDLHSNSTYSVQVTAFAIRDAAGNYFAGIGDTTTISFTTPDTVVPTLINTSPADDSTAVAVDGNIVLVFSENVQPGSGNIIVRSGLHVLTIPVNDATQVTFAGNTVTINPSVNLQGGSVYSVQMMSGVIRDSASNPFAGIADNTVLNFTTQVVGVGDITPPSLTVSTPADDATAVMMNSHIVLTFNEAVKAGNGNIVISDGAGDTRTISVNDSAQITVSGNAVTINPLVDLLPDSTYHVQMAAGVITDLAGNHYAGLAGPAALNFSTQDTIAPTLLGSTPNHGDVAIQAGVDIVLTFSEEVRAGAGNIVISDGIFDMRIIDVNDASQITISGNTVTINPAVNLFPERQYSVQMAAGVITDIAGNSFAGLSAGTDLAFETKDPDEPALIGSSPEDNEEWVRIGSDIVLTFDEAVLAGSGNIFISDGALDVRVIDVHDASQVTISGNTVTINPLLDLQANSHYSVQMGSGVFTDESLNAFAGIATATTLNFYTQDLIVPTLTGSDPVDDATGVPIGSPIVLTFSEAVAAGTGNIVISNGIDDTRIISVTDASQVEFNGNTVTVSPATGLRSNSLYSVQMAADVIRDFAGNAFAGIVSATALNFATQDLLAPTLSGSSPADDSVNVLVDGSIVLTFNEIVQAGSGNILISNGADTRIIDVGDASQVTISGNTVTINPAADLQSNSRYGVQMGAGVLRDLAGNAYAGLASATALDFDTQDLQAPSLTGSSPADDATAVLVGSNIVLTFSEMVMAGSGAIEISSGAGDTRTIDITDVSQVTFTGNTVTINPLASLLDGEQYHVRIDAGAIVDAAGNAYAGVQDNTTLDFSTVIIDSWPVLVGTSPAVDSSDVALGSDIVLTFSEAVQAGSGSIVISDGIFDVRIIDVNDASQVTISGNTVTINPAVNLFPERQYSVQMAVGVLRDLAGNSFAGLGSGALDFSTADVTPPAVPLLMLNADTGASSVDGVTNDDVINVGNLEAGATWEYSTNAGANWHAGAGSAFTLAEGTFAAGVIQVRQTDSSGNTSDVASNASDIVVDLSVATPTPMFVNDTGSSPDGVTNDNLVHVENLEAGGAWQYSTNGGANWNAGMGTSFLLAPGTYAIGSVQVRQADAAGNPSNIGSNALAMTVDVANPLLTGSNPADGATVVAVGSNIVLTFNEAVRSGTGNILIVNANDAGDTRTISVGDTSQVSLSGNTVTINPASNLLSQQQYYVQLAAGVIEDVAGNPYAGITDAATLNFATADVVAPVLVASTPSDNAGGVHPGSNIVLTFSEAVMAGSGVIEISNGTGDTRTISVTDSAQVSFSGSTVTINPISALIDGNQYRVRIDSGAIRDLAGNAYAGIQDNTTLNFSTMIIDTWPMLVGISPAPDSSNVAVGSNIVLTFSENVFAGTGSIVISDGVGDTRTISVTDTSQVQFSGNTVTINPAADLQTDRRYSVQYGSGVIVDIADIPADALLPGAMEFGTPDTIEPILIGSVPVDDSNGVLINSNIVLTFTESVRAGAGDIVISNGAGDVRTIAVTDAAQVTFSGNTVTINPAGDLFPNDFYSVEIGSGVITDTAGNAFVGVGSGTTNFVDFSTQDLRAPLFDGGSVPSDNDIEVPVGTNILLGFDEGVQAGSGNIVISNGAGDTRLIDVNDSSQVIFGALVSNIVTINLTDDLLPDSHYSVQMASGVIVDTAGNAFAGISDSTTLDFHTEDTLAPMLLGSVPGNGATAVLIGSNIVLTFSETVNAGSGNIVISNGAGDTRVIGVADSSQVNFSGNTVSINPLTNLLPNSRYSVQIISGVILDGAGNAFAGVSGATLGFDTQDLAVPTLLSRAPADNATAVGVSSNIVLTFSEAMQAGSGNIVISDGAGDTRTIDVSDIGQVNFNGSVVTINPTGNLLPNRHYSVTMANGVLQDLAGNAFAGVSAAELDFDTEDASAPMLISHTPADDAVAVLVGSNIVLTFSETVIAGTGNIVISDGAGDTRTIDVSDAGQVNFDGGVVTINPAGNLLSNSTYNVQIAAGVLTDVTGNAFAGITSATSLNFETQDLIAPELTGSTPGDNAIDVQINANVVLTFSENVQAGSGDIVLRNDAGDVRTISVTDSAQVTISGNTVTINPSLNLNSNSVYNVQMPSGVILDMAGNAYTGIADAATLNFGMQDLVPPAWVSTGPADGATLVPVDGNLVWTFSEAVVPGAGNIVISNGAGDTRTISITDTSQVTFSGNTITINPTQNLQGNSHYHVQIAYGVILDASGNSFAAISDTTTLDFETAGLPVELSAIAAGSGGFVINGQAASDYSGASVASAGDVNGDGFADLLIGAPHGDSAGGSATGRSYVVFGGTGTNAVDLSSVALGIGGFVINGQAATDYSGNAVSSAGDINGDGLNDILVGAPYSDPASGVNAGRSYVVFGKTSTTAVDLSAVSAGTGGIVINGQSAGDQGGSNVSSAGDVNGDGYADLIVGAALSDPAGLADAGRSYVLFGGASTASINLSAIAAGNGGFVINGQVAGDQSGNHVSGGGDINGDGLADLVLGAWNADPSTGVSAGKSYVIFGKTGNGAVDLSAIAAGNGGYVINGQGASDYSGFSVSFAGDVNGDGLADVVIGAPLGDASADVDSGRSYVVFGKTGSTSVELSSLAAGGGGFVINGQSAGDYSGNSVASAGDVNGDGLQDLLLGAPLGNTAGGVDAGRAYVIYGQTGAGAVELSAIALGAGGFVINGLQGTDYTGSDVSSAGDINGDGLSDLLVCAYHADPAGGVNAGRTFVIFGSTDGQILQTAVDQFGTANADTFTDTGTSQTLVTGQGNDSLTATAASVLYAGAGNDTLTINTTMITALQSAFGSGGNITRLARIDGGTGIDTLALSGSGITFDLTQIANQAASNPDGGSRIDSVEKIDLTGSGNNTLILSPADIRDMAGMNLFKDSNGWTGLGTTVQRHQLVVTGNLGDTVSASGVWIAAGGVSHSGRIYAVYNDSASAVQLLVDSEITFIASIDAPPTLIDNTPVADAVNVLVGSNIVLTFNEAMVAGTGDIVISNGTDTRTISVTDTSQVIISGNTVTINPTEDLFPDSTYSVQIASGVLRDMAGSLFPGISGTGLSFTTASGVPDEVLDVTLASFGGGTVAVQPGDAMQVQTYVLTNTGTGSEQFALSVNATQAGDDFDPANVAIYFDSNGNGIFESAADTLYVPSGAPAAAGNEPVLAANEALTVFVVADIPGATTDNDLGTLTLTAESLTAQETLGTDLVGHVFVGSGDGGVDAIVGSTQAVATAGNSFVVITPPTLNASSPTDDALAVQPNANIVLTFSKAVIAGTGNIVISNGAGDTRTINITDASQVSFSFSTVTINPMLDLLPGSTYNVQMAAGVIRSQDFLDFAGIHDNVTLNFRTEVVPVSLSSIAADNGGYVISGQVADQMAHGVKNAGDVNGDGFDDLLVEAYQSDAPARTDAGRTYVVFGKSDTTAINVTELTGSGTAGFVINGFCASDLSGSSIDGAGDINGDGLADLLVSAQGADPASRTDAGAAYVIFGKSDTAAVELSAVANNNGGFAISGACAGDATGTISSAGDINGDGLIDIVIGAASSDPAAGPSAGRTFVVFGKTGSGGVDLATVQGGTGGLVLVGVQASDESGVSVSAAGDVNGDGLADLLVGARLANPDGRTDVGSTYVVFGRTNAGAIELSAIAAGIGGFVVNGSATDDRSGDPVSAAGDVNGDGLADLLIGASQANAPGAVDGGRSYVVFGKTSTGAVEFSALNSGVGGFAINGAAGSDGSGNSVSSAGDINGDGLADVLVGAMSADANGANSGRAYAVFGKTDTTAVDLSAVAAGIGGQAIDGAAAGHAAGYVISGAGDANGDGLADITLGALFAGQAYVVFGSTAGGLLANAVDQFGTAGADTFTDAGISQTLVTGQGDDSLTATAESVLYAGAGNDTFTINATMITALQSAFGAGGNTTRLARIDGGTGLDTLVLSGSGITFDLTLIANQAASNPDGGSRIDSIERIDITGSGNNTLILTPADIRDMAGMNLFNDGNGWSGLGATVQRHQLVVLGDAGDTVSASGVWIAAGSVSNGGRTYSVFNDSASAVQLLVDNAINFTGAVDAAPTLQSSTPADNATAVMLGSNIVLTFSEAVIAGTGNVVITDGAGDTRMISITDASQVTFSGNTVTINPTADLFSERSYSVQMASGVIRDAAGSVFAGLSAGALDFDTQDMQVPTLTSSTPTDNAAAVLTGSDIVLNFSEEVLAGFGSIVISSAAGDIRTIDVTDTSQVTFGGNTVTISPTAALKSNSHYSVQMVSGVITDVAGNSFAGITGSAALDFHTTGVDLSAVAANLGGFVINGQASGDASGISVSSAGDVNGDGFIDLIVGATGSDPAGKAYAGRTYVVFGKSVATAVDLSAVAGGIGGFVINGQAASDESGNSVSGAGDVNGDGLADLIVGACDSDPASGSYAGRSYVVFGKSNTQAVELSAVSLGTSGFVINGQAATDQSGYSVSAAGDVNGDGLADVVIGALGSDPAAGSAAGRSYVVFGKGDSTAVDLSAIVGGAGGFAINGQASADLSGRSVSSAGDVNGDGFSDLIVGASDSDPATVTWAGRSYIVFGKSSGVAVDLSAVANGLGGFVVNGQAASDQSGFSVSLAGDVNGDGYSDLIIGARASDPASGIDAGRSYVVFGKSEGGAVNLSAVAAGVGGFVINGQCAGDTSGISVSNAGDLNGDGLADLLVGAENADPLAGSNAGRSYVVFGKTTFSAVDLSAVANGNGGFAIHGHCAGDFSGGSVASAGDVNGDGLADLFIGVSWGDPAAGNEAGRSYVIFGNTGGAFAQNAVDQYGTTNADTFTDSDISQTLVTGQGDDSLTATAASVLYAGAGNDTLTINTAMVTALQSAFGAGGNTTRLARIDGGTGIDTLALSGGGFTLDLTQIANQGASNPGGGSRIDSIEKIDLTGSGNNTLVLSPADIRDMTGMNLFNDGNGWTGLGARVQRHQLVVAGDAGDTVSASGVWIAAGSVSNGGRTYSVFNDSASAVQLLVDNAISSAGTVDVAPTLQSSTPADDATVVLVGSNIVLTFSEAVVAGSGNIVISNGTDTKEIGIGDASQITISGSTVTINPLTDLQANSHYNVQMASGVVKDAAGNNFAGITNGTVLDFDTTSIALSAISAGVGGFVINGQCASDGSGFSVSNAGDVNGDGLDDVVVGAPYSDPAGIADAGRSYVVFGRTSLAPVNLSAIAAGAGGFVIEGKSAVDQSGFSVSGAGDVNGDGLADIVLGAPNADPFGVASAGVGYVVFGKTGNTPVTLSLVESGVGGFVLNGQAASDWTGWSVAGAGDVNGDGLDEILIGAYGGGAGADTPGRSYLVFGRTATSPVDLASISTVGQGFVMNGQAAGDVSGWSLSGGGDVNGDGFADLVIGARGGSAPVGGGAGRSYVVFGKSDITSVNLSGLSQSGSGFLINGQAASDDSGRSVSAAGDVNGDGLADLIVGAPYGDPSGISNAGRSYIVFGKTGTTTVDLSAVAGVGGGFVINGQASLDQSGFCVSGAGDINGDGLADLLVGADGADGADGASSGITYVVYGKADSSAVELSAVAAGVGGFAIEGQAVADSSGRSISMGGDINGDGLRDLVVGAYASDPAAGGSAGRSYVIFGSTTGAFAQNTIDQFGTTGADVFSDGGTAQTLVTGQGDDMLTALAASILYAGAGNDVINIFNVTMITALQSAYGSGGNTTQLARIDGGTGIDTLALFGSGLTLDLTLIANQAASNPDGGSRIDSIERISIAGFGGDNTLILNLNDVLDMGSANTFVTNGRQQLLITGNAGDTVDLADASGTTNWTQSGTASIDSVTYNVWNHNTALATVYTIPSLTVI